MLLQIPHPCLLIKSKLLDLWEIQNITLDYYLDDIKIVELPFRKLETQILIKLNFSHTIAKKF